MRLKLYNGITWLKPMFKHRSIASYNTAKLLSLDNKELLDKELVYAASIKTVSHWGECHQLVN